MTIASNYALAIAVDADMKFAIECAAADAGLSVSGYIKVMVARA